MTFVRITLAALTLMACSTETASSVVKSNAGAGEAPTETPAPPSPPPLADGSSCLSSLACAAPAMPQAPQRAWRHMTSGLFPQGSANHRGRDLFVNPGAPQWVLGKFAYGTNDNDLEDEEVDIFVQRDCAGGGAAWEKLGTAITGKNGAAHAAIEGVEGSDGRIFFEIPTEKHLGPGRHRVRLVVAGDGSSADMFIDVVPPSTPIFISDVDGTLTSSEAVEFEKMLTGDLPETHPGAPEALRALAAKGYRAMYLTARPEWLVARTRAFLERHNFPPGIIHTSTSALSAGAGATAAAFKAGEMKMLADKGLTPRFGFGNKSSDADAYAPINPADHRILFQISGEFTGRRIDSYNELITGFNALPALCQ